MFRSDSLKVLISPGSNLSVSNIYDINLVVDTKLTKNRGLGWAKKGEYGDWVGEIEPCVKVSGQKA